MNSTYSEYKYLNIVIKKNIKVNDIKTLKSCYFKISCKQNTFTFNNLKRYES